MAGQIEYDNDPNIICLNDAVMLHSNRKGVVRYISDKTQDRIAVGIELTEPNPSGFADVSKLFACKPQHGILIPLTQIARKLMPEELLIQLQFLTTKVIKYHKQIEDLRKKIVENENRYASWITNQFLSVNNFCRNNTSNTNNNNYNKGPQRHRRNHYISHRSNSNNQHKHRLNNNENDINQNVYTFSSNHNQKRRGLYDEASHTSHTQHTQNTQPQPGTKRRVARHNSHSGIDFISSDVNVSLQQYQDPNNRLSMSLNLKNEKRLHGMPTFSKRTALQYNEYNEKQKRRQISKSNSIFRRKKKLSTATSPARHHKHSKNIKDKDISIAANTYLVMESDIDEMSSNSNDGINHHNTNININHV